MIPRETNAKTERSDSEARQERNSDRKEINAKTKGSEKNAKGNLNDTNKKTKRRPKGNRKKTIRHGKADKHSKGARGPASTFTR